MPSITEKLLGPAQEPEKTGGNITEKLLGGAPVLEPVTVDSEKRPMMSEQTQRVQSTLGSPINLLMNKTEVGSPKTTEETLVTPEIGSAPVSAMQGARLALGLASTFGEDGQIEVIKNIIPEAGIRKDEKGNTFVNIKGQDYLLNRPGLSEQDLLQNMAVILSFVPAGRLASGMATTLGKITAGFGADAATSLGLDAISASQGADVDPMEAAGRATITGGIGAAIPAAGGAYRGISRIARGEPKLPVDALPETKQAIEEANKASEATGVELFPGQKTMIPSQLNRQRAVGELPGGAQTAYKALTKQNEQVATATTAYLNSIAPASSVETGAARFRSASEKAIDVAREARKEKASPLYEAAFKSGAEVDVSAVIRSITAQKESYPRGGQIHGALSKIESLLRTAAKTRETKSIDLKMVDPITGQRIFRTEENIIRESNLRRLHNVKTEIDQMIASRKDGGLGPTTKRELAIIQEQLLSVLDDASPEYAKAREAFRQASPAVDELKEGLIGRAANVDDMQLRQLAGMIFNPAETNPQVVQRVRAIIDTVDPAAYDQLLRSELERRLGAIRTTQGAVQNTPGQVLRALFGNDKQKSTLYAALRKNQQGNARFLETALQRASLGRPGGSDTTAKQEIRDQIKGASSAIREWISNPLTGIPKTIANIGEDAALQRKAMAVARLMYDPSFARDIRAIRQIRNPTEAEKQMKALLNAALVSEVREASQSQREAVQPPPLQ